jgi:hypothetical protein
MEAPYDTCTNASAEQSVLGDALQDGQAFRRIALPKVKGHSACVRCALEVLCSSLEERFKLECTASNNDFPQETRFEQVIMQLLSKPFASVHLIADDLRGLTVDVHNGKLLRICLGEVVKDLVELVVAKACLLPTKVAYVVVAMTGPRECTVARKTMKRLVWRRLFPIEVDFDGIRTLLQRPFSLFDQVTHVSDHEHLLVVLVVHCGRPFPMLVMTVMTVMTMVSMVAVVPV